jgi:hypothetical protein
MESRWMSDELTTCASANILDTDVLLWFAVLGAVVLAGFVLILLVRRMAFGTYKIKKTSPIEQLGELREKGLITKQEYDQGRRATLGLSQRPPTDGNATLPPAQGTRM